MTADHSPYLERYGYTWIQHPDGLYYGPRWPNEEAQLVLLILGVIRGRELLVVGAVPAEDLGRVIGVTVFSLVIGLGLLVWGLVGRVFRR